MNTAPISRFVPGKATPGSPQHHDDHPTQQAAKSTVLGIIYGSNPKINQNLFMTLHLTSDGENTHTFVLDQDGREEVFRWPNTVWGEGPEATPENLRSLILQAHLLRTGQAFLSREEAAKEHLKPRHLYSWEVVLHYMELGRIQFSTAEQDHCTVAERACKRERSSDVLSPHPDQPAAKIPAAELLTSMQPTTVPPPASSEIDVDKLWKIVQEVLQAPEGTDSVLPPIKEEKHTKDTPMFKVVLEMAPSPNGVSTTREYNLHEDYVKGGQALVDQRLSGYTGSTAPPNPVLPILGNPQTHLLSRTEGASWYEMDLHLAVLSCQGCILSSTVLVSGEHFQSEADSSVVQWLNSKEMLHQYPVGTPAWIPTYTVLIQSPSTFYMLGYGPIAEIFEKSLAAADKASMEPQL